MNKVKNILENLLITILLILIAFCGVSLARGERHTPSIGGSMYPTMDGNQRVIITPSSKYSKGDIVCIKLETHDIIKRIVAVSGDEVEVENGYVYVNGKLQNDFSYNGWENYIHSELEKKASYSLKENEIFVMGDNYASSRDSRYYGLFTENQIEGIVTKENALVAKILDLIDFK